MHIVIKLEKGRKMEKSLYYLEICTNSYTGNFVKEFVGFCIGIIDDKGSVTEYTKAFWNNVIASDIYSLEKYKEMEKQFLEHYLQSSEEILEQMNRSRKSRLRNITHTLEEAEAFRNRYIEKKKDNKLISFYETGLCYTSQWVSDVVEDTFYNIACSGPDSFADKIYIQLNDPLNKEIEDIIIPRIMLFFDDNVMQIIEAYIWLCHNGSIPDELYAPKEISLLKLELIHQSGEVIRKYL